MNKKFLLKLRKKAEAQLLSLRTKLEGPDELREDEVTAIQEEVTELNEEIREIDEALESADDNEDDATDDDDEDDPENKEDENRGGGQGEPEQRSATPENRQAAMTAITSALSTRNAKSTKKKEQEVRSAFAKFVVGHISEQEARSLGVNINNGSVVIPEVIASEVITYAQEENLLRKYGTVHRTKGDVKYPVLVRKATANVTKSERLSEIIETDIEFDEVLLSPAEFDALATVTKKLLAMSGVNVEAIVIDELKKAYVRKETNYMFNGNDVGNENPGALAKKAVAFYETEAVDITAVGYSQKLYQQLVKVKNQPVTEVLKKSIWIVNRAALTVLEGMTDTTGRPLLHVDATDGVSYKLLGHKLDFTDAADGADQTKPVFYFGDFKAFNIQDVIGGMQLQKLVEKFAGTNKIGYQIYNLLDGQLIYSPFEPAVYRYEVGATAPGGG